MFSIARHENGAKGLKQEDSDEHKDGKGARTFYSFLTSVERKWGSGEHRISKMVQLWTEIPPKRE